MEYRNLFIKESKSFIRASAVKTIHRFVTEQDDEWSVALIAFNEAIEKYEPGKGRFSSFAELVIKRRLTDELRNEYRRKTEIPTEPEAFDGDRDSLQEGLTADSEVHFRVADQALQNHASVQRQKSAADEIEAVKELLERYGFSFFDLADSSPKTEKTKMACAKLVNEILADEALFLKMRESKTLPMQELLKRTGVKKKVAERHRRYIIAAAEILNGEYPLLAEYMSYIRKSMKT